MPLNISRLFWVSIPLVLVAVIYQAGVNVLDVVTNLFPNFVVFKLIRQIFTTTHCYVSIKTLSSTLPHAECFSVFNGKFAKVFLDETSFNAVKEARTGYVIPGLWDGHGHLLQYGELLSSVNLFGAESMDEVQQRLVQYKAGHSEAGTAEYWLRGVGWDQANFKGKWPVSVSN